MVYLQHDRFKTFSTCQKHFSKDVTGEKDTKLL